MITIGISGFESKKGGAYSTVFIKNGRALKLFKSYKHPDYDGTGKERISEESTNEYYGKVFQTQVEAYKCVQKSDLLKRFTPKFYGPIAIANVIVNGRDISDCYLLDCCYEMDYIEGTDEELLFIRRNSKKLQKLEQLIGFNLLELDLAFKEAGINYTDDSTAIYNEKEFKIIDFATINSHSFEPIINANLF